MATHQARPEKQAVPMPVILATIALLIIFCSWWGYRSLGPQDRGKTQVETSTDGRIARLAQQSGKDISKLSEEDRHWLQNVTQGHGAEALKTAK